MIDSASGASPASRRGVSPWLSGILALYAAAITFYSLTSAHAYDEAYHLLASQLINAGKQPYLDFCYPQAPLNAYWNAIWMRLLGHTWRVPHLLATFATIGAVVLIADYMLRRFPVPAWRFYAAITAGLAFGLNQMVFGYATLAQAYGICLFTLALAFRLSIRAVDRERPWLAAAAGLAAGTATASSLLTATAAIVFVLWLCASNRAGSRWTKTSAFLIAAAIPWIPVARLFVLGPRQTWFNLVEYHAVFRRLYWPETTRHDLEVLTSWIDSGQALLLGLLAVIGIFFVARASRWPRERKSEYYLCAWLALGISLELSVAHPTFSQYFLLAVPFLAVLAVAGLYAIVSRALQPPHPKWPALLVIAFFAAGLAKALYDGRDDLTWGKYQEVADKVEQVTPRSARLFAIEPIYFLTNRMPPEGLELSYTHELPLPPGDAALFHILSDDELTRRLHAEDYATAVNDEEDLIEKYGLNELYRQHATLHDVQIFWDRVK